MTYAPVEIKGVIAEKVGTPRNDGTAGSGLYAVPIRLSRSLATDEADVLERLWDSPPRFTTMHRPGIARVVGDVITLDGTTIDEVEQYHAATLATVIESFNQHMSETRTRQAAQRQREAEAAEAHRQHVEDVAERVRFDEHGPAS